MPVYIVFAEIPGNPVYIDHVVAPDITTAQTTVTAAINTRYKGINSGPFQVALILAGSTFTVTP